MVRFKIRLVFGLCLCSRTLMSVMILAADEKSSGMNQPRTIIVGTADDNIPAGHSLHGEVFNEGPRQKAYLMGGTGKLVFPITTNNPLAQKFFTQGVGQLHGFWYFEAERSFRQAAVHDPDCAMAYWGMAQANIKNEKRALGFIAEAIKRKEGIREREAMYIEAFERYLRAGNTEGSMDRAQERERRQQYAQGLQEIVNTFGHDFEAKAFLALQSSGKSPRDRPLSSYEAVDALFDQVFGFEPLHPAHHYRIHLWDQDQEKSEMALESAAVCGPCAPSIAHMWHMAGHTYSKLNRYADAVWQQEAAARVDHAHMIRDCVLPDQIHNFAHNNEWLVRNLGHVGRVHGAIDLAKNMIELPRHPKNNTLENRGSAYYGRLRLFETMSAYELWEDIIRLADTSYLEPTDNEAEQVRRLRYLGRAYFRSEDMERGRQQLAALYQRLERLKLTPAGEESSPEPREREETAEATIMAESDSEAKVPATDIVRSVEIAIEEFHGYIAIADGDYKTGLERLMKVHEADKQMRVNGVGYMYIASLQLLAGQGDVAEKTARNFVENRAQEVRPLAQLVDLLWQRDKRQEAAEAFGELRKISADFDLDLPISARLAPIARELKLPADWRLKRPSPDDLGDRPPLDSLGPFRWHPAPAPDWNLSDARGEKHTLKQYRGKPLVLIFYLGFGCLHCAQQLKAFAPKSDAFSAAGIQLIAISTDNLAGLQKSLETYGEKPFPFLLLSGSDLATFQSYRAYDDFENRPLHGTFVIDGDGLVRWQDIGYEPFMEPDFALKEAQRLISYPVSRELLADTGLASEKSQVAPAEMRVRGGARPAIVSAWTTMAQWLAAIAGICLIGVTISARIARFRSAGAARSKPTRE